MIADFGIALAVAHAGGSRVTETGLSLGTPQYMSPEQATGDRDLDARSDQYALGAVTYEMLSGEPPHTGPTAQAIIARLKTETPRSLRATRPNISPKLDGAVLRALAKAPADRFPGCGEFARVAGDTSGVATVFGVGISGASPDTAADRPSRCWCRQRSRTGPSGVAGLQAQRPASSGRSRCCRWTTIRPIPPRTTSPRE